MGPLAGARGIVVVVLAVLLTSLILVPIAIWLAIRWALVVPVIEVERASATGSLRRSARLVRHGRLKVVSTSGERHKIMRRHSVSRPDIVAATRARVWLIDAVVVLLPMVLLLLLAIDRITRRVCRAFDSDDRLIARISVTLLVPVVALLATGVTQDWAIGVESLRLRNNHVSFRAFQVPVVAHGWTTFLVGCAACTLLAAWRLRATPLTGMTRRCRARATAGIGSWQLGAGSLVDLTLAFAMDRSSRGELLESE